MLKKAIFKKTIVIGLLAGSLSAPAFAADSSREESVGVGLGAIIGGAAGGPVGAIIGAAFGAKLGEEFHERETEVEELSNSLTDSNSQVVVLQSNVRSMSGEMQELDNELREVREFARPELLALLEAGIEMDLLFRTGEDNLADTTGGKLSQLAGSLVSNTDIKIRLDGYADERGDEAYNQALSQRRVEHVRDLLVTHGIPNSRITIEAHGEAQAPDATVDNFALERRVSLTLYMSDAPSLAANPR